MEAVKSLLTEKEEFLHLSQKEAPAAGNQRTSAPGLPGGSRLEQHL